MTEQAEVGSTQEQSSAASPETANTGKEAASKTAASQGAQPETEEQFHDPKDLPEELKPHFKQMQRSFTKKMQSIKDSKSKVAAYDDFMRDQVGNIQRIASQMGYKLTRADAQAAAEQQKFEPQTWDQVLSEAQKRGADEAERRILQKYAPVLQSVQQIKQQQIEQSLDDQVPGWRQYEDGMIDLMQKHPSLATDPVSLAKLAIPAEVQESRAMQAALKQLQKKVESTKVSSGSTTSRMADGERPSGPVTFSEAALFAKEKLARQGIRP